VEHASSRAVSRLDLTAICLAGLASGCLMNLIVALGLRCFFRLIGQSVPFWGCVAPVLLLIFFSAAVLLTRRSEPIGDQPLADWINRPADTAEGSKKR
jgi:hypothetical protein